ncbi:hypothetical protein CSUB01_08019 [Colletotrichum sublineola]|uniref:Uncharacterized protein n=1 Tax=Colletotrichum sublineola TaxID=1173701 RepID=A0A066WSX9_COLSU|nr:hypothetical protein CSUB01_08019 [Colletotrichum sublineola]
MAILACYDHKRPTPSTDHPRGSTTADGFSLTEYSGSKQASLPCVRNSLSGYLGDIRSGMSARPPPFSSERPQVNLPRLRELDDASFPAELSKSVIYSSRSIGFCGSFPRSAMVFPKTRASMPPTAHGRTSGLSLSRATSQGHHGAREWPLLDRGFLPDWHSVTLHTGATASRRPRRSTGRAHCNVKYTPEQVVHISYLRDDCGLSWKEVAEEYASAFPEDAEQGHKRGPLGLQGIYYRQNKRSSHHAQKRQCGGIGMIFLPACHPDRTITDDNEGTGRARQRHHEADHQKRCEQVQQQP